MARLIVSSSRLKTAWPPRHHPEISKLTVAVSSIRRRCDVVDIQRGLDDEIPDVNFAAFQVVDSLQMFFHVVHSRTGKAANDADVLLVAG